MKEHESQFEELYRRYRREEGGREAYIDLLARRLYEEPGYYGFRDVDEAADAFVCYRPRILGYLDRYVERGASFDAFVTANLRWLAKSQRRTKRRQIERECACEVAESDYRRGSGNAEGESAGFPESGLSEVEGEGRIPSLPAKRPLKCATRSRRLAHGNRILYLFLKCAWDAGDIETRRVAELTGLSEEWLSEALAHSRRYLEAERCRYERIAARRDRSWTALRICEARMADELDAERRRDHVAALDRARREYEAALEELHRFRPLVPNSVIAKILRLPKGSVDSGLYYLRRDLKAACIAEDDRSTVDTWKSSSPPAMPTSSSNSHRSSRDTGSENLPTSVIPISTSKKTVRPISRTPSKKPARSTN